MTVKDVLAQLEPLGDEARRSHNTRAGAPDNQFGVTLGAIGIRHGALRERAVAIGEKVGLYKSREQNDLSRDRGRS